MSRFSPVIVRLSRGVGVVSPAFSARLHHISDKRSRQRSSYPKLGFPEISQTLQTASIIAFCHSFSGESFTQRRALFPVIGKIYFRKMRFLPQSPIRSGRKHIVARTGYLSPSGSAACLCITLVLMKMPSPDLSL